LPTNDFIVGAIMKLYCQDLNDFKIVLSMLNNSRKSETANFSCLTDLSQNSRIKNIIIFCWFIIKSWTITRKWSRKKWRIKKDIRLNDVTKYIWQKSSFSLTSLSFNILPSYNNYFFFLFNSSEYRWKNLLSRNRCQSRPKHNWQIKDNITKRRKKKIFPRS